MRREKIPMRNNVADPLFLLEIQINSNDVKINTYSIKSPEQESLCAALFDRSKRRKTAALAPNKLYTKIYLPTVHFKKYMYLYSTETNYIPNFELIGSL